MDINNRIRLILLNKRSIHQMPTILRILFWFLYVSPSMTLADQWCTTIVLTIAGYSSGSCRPDTDAHAPDSLESTRGFRSSSGGFRTWFRRTELQQRRRHHHHRLQRLHSQRTGLPLRNEPSKHLFKYPLYVRARAELHGLCYGTRNDSRTFSLWIK